MSGLTRAARAQVITRDQGRCVLTGQYLVNPDTLEPFAQFSLHHRRPRGMGGSRDATTNHPSNALLLSGSGTTGAHGWVESHRTDAIKAGFIVPQWQDPALVPVRHFLYGPAFPGEDEWWPLPQGPEGTAAIAAHAARLAQARGLTAEGLTHISQALTDLIADWIKEVA